MMNQNRTRTLLTLLAVSFCCSAIGTTKYGDLDATGTATGNSWANAYNSFAVAVQAAHTDVTIDTILIAEGTYYPEYPTNGTSTNNCDKSFTFTRDGLALLGGYPAGGGTRDWQNNETILSGDLGVSGSLADNSYHVIINAGTFSDPINSSLLFDGLTIKDGRANGSFTLNVNSQFVVRTAGGGVINYLSSPTLANVRISGNSGSGGGGIANFYSSSVIRDAYIVGNSSSSNGGGILNGTIANPTINRSFISGNSANQGRGIYNLGSNSVSIVNSVISGNTATTSGGGAYNDNFRSNEVIMVSFGRILLLYLRRERYLMNTKPTT